MKFLKGLRQAFKNKVKKQPSPKITLEQLKNIPDRPPDMSHEQFYKKLKDKGQL